MRAAAGTSAGVAVAYDGFAVHSGAENGHDAGHLFAPAFFADVFRCGVEAFQKFADGLAFAALIFINRHKFFPSPYLKYLSRHQRKYPQLFAVLYSSETESEKGCSPLSNKAAPLSFFIKKS